MNAIVQNPHFTDTTATSSLGHHTVLTANRQADFLKSLQLFGNVRLACRSACVSAQTAYRARRASAGFALAWDAALLAARAQAEAVLADRALNGVEEAVYYHGEEVARRRRYDSRLLLAHLARLDRLEEREEVASALPLLDGAIAALGEGADIDHILRFRMPDDNGREAVEGSSGTSWVPASAGTHQGSQNSPQDPVPCVPSCRTSPRSSSGAVAQTRARSSNAAVARTRTRSSSGAVAQTETPEPEPELETRLCAMEAARPAEALLPHQLAGDGHDSGAVEHAQLLAFEAGQERWWEVVPEA